jgi:hypothetical protein
MVADNLERARTDLLAARLDISRARGDRTVRIRRGSR